MAPETLEDVAMLLATTGGSGELPWETPWKRSPRSLLALGAVGRCWVRDPES